MSAFHDNALIGASGSQGYQISRSVRLRSSASAYFNRTFTTPTDNKKWTMSMWLKRGSLGGSINIFGSVTTGGYFEFRFNTSDQIYIQNRVSSTNLLVANTTAVYRDPSAWYHIVFAFDSANATAANRNLLYVNGVNVALSANSGSGDACAFNSSGNTQYIGNSDTYTTFDGYMTEVNFIDGQALTPSSFGETDSVTGVWKPKKYAGTYGTNGFYLNFSDNSGATATTIGKDYSGNGNNWTPNNISVTSGSTYDSMLDVPTMWADGGNGRGNYATLNPLGRRRTVTTVPTFSDGNLRVAFPNAGGNATFGIGTIGVTSGKWYWEVSIVTRTTEIVIGLGNTGTLDETNGGSGYQSTTGTFSGFTSNPSAAASYTSGDVIGVAFDVDAGTCAFYKNNVLQGMATGLLSTPHPWIQGNTSDVVTVNFGQRPFAYTPPSGFKALNTQNLPAPTISNGALYMAATTYTGNGGTQSITNTVNGVSFKPDLVWIKTRSATSYHQLIDSVRGVSTVLNSNYTGAESSYPGYSVTAFNSNGFTVVDDAAASYGVNGSTGSPTYVGWQWKKGATPGFDIVTYTGNGASGRDIAHSLGVKPSMIITKARTDATYNWHVWHTGIDADYYISLNTTAARDNSVNVFPYAGITSSSFRTSTAGVAYNNLNAVTYVAYLFAEVAGFSKFGSYTGNGSSTDGPFVYLGFRPRWIMVKSSTSVQDWKLLDTSRNPYNSTNSLLGANISAAEDTNTAYDFDILSNGFKPRNTFGYANTNGATYIFAAFAENPFKYALAR